MQFRKLLQKDFTVQKSPQKIIIDCKGGLYDIQAIVIALHLSKQYNKQILGITCVAGEKQNVQGAMLDALVACKIYGTKIPIYIGSKQSMLLKTQSPCLQCLQDHSQTLKSFRSILTGQEIQQCKKNDKSAIQFLVQSGKVYESKLGIICLGPMTNLSITYHMDYSFGNLAMVSAYGGQYTGVGNVKGHYSAQRNFQFDPVAAHLVIKNFSQNVYLNPLQFALEFNLENKNIEALQSIFDKKQSQRKEQYELLFRNKSLKMPYGWGQILATIPIFNHKAVSKHYHCYCQVSLQNEHIQGFLCIDWLRIKSPLKQIQNTRIFAVFNEEQIVKDLGKVFE